jgi:hypothetical protein
MGSRASTGDTSPEQEWALVCTNPQGSCRSPVWFAAMPASDEAVDKGGPPDPRLPDRVPPDRRSTVVAPRFSLDIAEKLGISRASVFRVRKAQQPLAQRRAPAEMTPSAMSSRSEGRDRRQIVRVAEIVIGETRALELYHRCTDYYFLMLRTSSLGAT